MQLKFLLGLRLELEEKRNYVDKLYKKKMRSKTDYNIEKHKTAKKEFKKECRKAQA